MRYAFLVGAGVSIPAPSRVPGSVEILDEVLRVVTPEAGPGSRARNLPKAPLESDRHTNEFLRFETVMEILNELVDPNLELLGLFNLFDQPNSIHRFLASRALAGDVVATTNFDDLIERAVLALGGRPWSVLPSTPLIPEGEWQPIYKLHGSLRRWKGSITDSSSESVRASLAKIVADSPNGRLPGPMMELLDRAFVDREVIILGYSGNDDFDVVPSLYELRPHRVVWFSHEVGATGWSDRTSDLEGDGSIQVLPGERYLRSLLSQGSRAVYLKGATQKWLTDIFSVHPGQTQDVGVQPNWKQFVREWATNRIDENQRRLVAARMLYSTNKLETVRACLEMIPIARLEGPAKATAAWLLVNAYIHEEQFDAAQTTIELAIASEPGSSSPSVVRAHLLHELGYLLLLTGDNEEAERLLIESLDESRTAEYLTGECYCLHDLGLIELDRGNLRQAKSYFEASLSLSRKLGNARHTSMGLTELGIMAYESLDLGESAQRLSEAAELARRLGDIRQESNIEHELGNLALAQGDSGLAITHAERALALDELMTHRRWAPIVFHLIGQAHLEAGNLELAESAFEEAALRYLSTKERFWISELWVLRAILELVRGNRGYAAELAKEAVLEAAKTGSPELEIPAQLIKELAKQAPSAHVVSHLLDALSEHHLYMRRIECMCLIACLRAPNVTPPLGWRDASKLAGSIGNSRRAELLADAARR